MGCQLGRFERDLGAFDWLDRLSFRARFGYGAGEGRREREAVRETACMRLRSVERDVSLIGLGRSQVCDWLGRVFGGLGGLGLC